MIHPNARLVIRRIPIEFLHVKEVQPRYPGRVLHYIGLLTDNPGMYAGLLYVVPSDTHDGMFAILDGHHRYVAAIIAGRADVLCVVELPPDDDGEASLVYQPARDAIGQFYADLAHNHAQESRGQNWPKTGPLDQGEGGYVV